MPDDEQKPTDPPPEAEDKPVPVDEPPPAEAEPEDKFRPEAIAARVDKLGQESEVDRIAREEERKLGERKKGKKGKKGLEAAASKRLAKIGEVKVKRPSAASDAFSADADPLLERTARLTKWIKDHGQTFGALVAVAVLGAVGGVGYVYWQGRQQDDASAILAQAFADEHGHVSDKDDDDDEADTSRQLYPTFKTVVERRDAAIAKYRQVESKYAGTGAAILARLAEGGLLLDANDPPGAKAAYADVKSSALAQADAEVHGRAIEGTGFADELLAASDVANKDKHLDDALASFKALESIDMKGFKELGQYHEARVLQAKGDKAKAIEILKDLEKRVSEPNDQHPYAYLEFVVGDRLRELDPSALPPKPKAPRGGPGGPGGGAGGAGGTDPEMEKRIQELIKQMQQKGEAPPGGPPGAPPGAP